MCSFTNPENSCWTRDVELLPRGGPQHVVAAIDRDGRWVALPLPMDNRAPISPAGEQRTEQAFCFAGERRSTVAARLVVDSSFKQRRLPWSSRRRRERSSSPSRTRRRAFSARSARSSDSIESLGRFQRASETIAQAEYRGSPAAVRRAATTGGGVAAAPLESAAVAPPDAEAGSLVAQGAAHAHRDVTDVVHCITTRRYREPNHPIG